MKQLKPQHDRPARSGASRVKAPRYTRPLTFAPPPVQGQTEFNFDVIEKREGGENNR